MGFDFYGELVQMRENYQRNPLKDIRLSYPAWMTRRDPMFEIYEKKAALLQQGQIVYACIVQANSLLFHTFPLKDCPGQVLYSADPYLAEHPEFLYDASQRIFSYKGRNRLAVPEEWREVARVITNEYDHSDFTFSVKLDGIPVEYHMIPTMIYRKLLPKGKLCGNLLPVFTMPGCKQVVILLKRYWTKAFKDAWTQGRN
jgi:hypothetical protein